MIGKSEEAAASEPGRLLATVRFAGTRWLPGDWAKALFIFDRCFVYSAGRSREFLKAALNPLNPAELARGNYEEGLVADADMDLDELVGQHPANWIVWSSEVAKWDLRAGVAASRLRLELVNGTRRKVLWGRFSNSLPSIESALHHVLGDTQPA